MFVYLFGHLMILSVLSELLIARGDRRYLRRLSTVLASAGGPGSLRAPSRRP
jgi:hypothetical protein